MEMFSKVIYEMSMKRLVFIMFLLILLVIPLNGCVKTSLDLNPDEDFSTPKSDETLQMSSTITPIPTNEFIATQGKSTNSSFSGTEIFDYPDIVINYGPDIRDPLSGIYLCDNLPQTFLIYASFPFYEFRVMPNRTQNDQNFPSLSPDGNKIAFIDSHPQSYYMDSSQPLLQVGNDRIELIDINGNSILLSEQSLDRLDFRTLKNDCEAKSMISSKPTWSKDGRFLVFSYINRGDNFLHKLFVFDIIENSINLVSDETLNWMNVIWFEDQNIFVDFNKNGLLMVTIDENGSIIKDYFPWPFTADINNDFIFKFLQYDYISENDGVHKLKGVLTSRIYENQKWRLISETVQEFNFELREWKMIKKLDQSFKSPILLENDFIFGCDNHNQLVLLDLKNNKYMQKKLPMENTINCQTIHKFNDRTGKTGLSFWVEGNLGGLWVTDPFNINSSLTRIISQDDLPNNTKNVPDEIYISEDSFKNVIDYFWMP